MDRPKLIEIYGPEGTGLQPVLIKDSWQIAQLNYSVSYDVNYFDNLEVNQNSDKSISLLNGNAVLITASDRSGAELEILLLKRGISYNIPQNMGHKILMTKGSKIFIVAQSNAHLNNTINYFLDTKELKEIRQKVNQILIP